MSFWNKDISRFAQMELELNEHSPEFYRAKAEASKKAWKQSWLMFLKTGIFVLAILVVLLGSLAWFANNKQVDGNGVSVNVGDADLYLTNYQVVYWERGLTENDRERTYTIHDETNVSLVEIAMVPLDMLSVTQGQNDRNYNTPVVFRIPISGEALKAHKQIVVTVTNTGEPWKTTTDGKTLIGAYFSNITQIQCGALSVQGVDMSKPADIWELAVENLDGTPLTFVQKSSNPDKNNSVQFTLSYADYSAAIDDNGVLNVFIKIDYSLDLAKEYVSFNSASGDIGLNAGNVKFAEDFKSIDIQTVAVS